MDVGQKALRLWFKGKKKPFQIDREAKTITLETTRAGYIPLHIVKLLTKIGLSLLPEEEVSDFDWACEFITTTTYDYQVKNDKRFQLYLQFIPGVPAYPLPYAQLFTRRQDHTENVFEKQIVIYYANYVLQLVLPCCRLDAPRLLGKVVLIPTFPPNVSEIRQAKFGPIQSHILNLTAATKTKKEPHSLTFSFEVFIKLPISRRGATWRRRYPKHDPFISEGDEIITS